MKAVCPAAARPAARERSPGPAARGAGWSGPARRPAGPRRAGCPRRSRAVPSYRWGPREIDVDILLFGDQQVDEPGLTIPHPGLRDRDFVREPLAELRPDILLS